MTEMQSLEIVEEEIHDGDSVDKLMGRIDLNATEKYTKEHKASKSAFLIMFNRSNMRMKPRHGSRKW